MTFKEARKEARKIAQQTGYWGYIFKDKSGKWFTSDCNNFTSANKLYSFIMYFICYKIYY